MGCRVPLVRDGLVGTGAVSAELRLSARPLTGLRLLDVGCGGGLLSEPLARLGAQVTGIDPAQENIQVRRSPSGAGMWRQDVLLKVVCVLVVPVSEKDLSESVRCPRR